MIFLAENSILIIASVANNLGERCLHLSCVELLLVLDLCQAVVLISFDDEFDITLIQKGRVRENEFTAFKFGRIRW